MRKRKIWTVMLSSGAKEPIKQFRISRELVYFSISSVCVAMIALVALSVILTMTSNDKSHLSALLDKRTAEIEQIKQEYALLQQETLTVQKSIEEFKSFEERLSNLNLDIPVNFEVFDGSGGKELPIVNETSTQISENLIEMKRELPELIERFEDTLARLTQYEQELRSVPTIIPASGRITSIYGNRVDPFTYKAAFHSGIDIAAPKNTPIYAAADGKITFAGRKGGYGLMITIDHGNTYETIYGHLNSIDVNVGQSVKKGEVIGGMGTTGRSTGVHLHYEILKDGQNIDPYLYMTFHERNDQ